MGFLTSLKRTVGAILGKRMMWVEMDLHTGVTTLPQLIWINRRMGNPVQTVTTKWGELVVTGPFRMQAGLPLYRYREGDVRPFAILGEGEDAALARVHVPPHALKVAFDARNFEQTYQDRMTLWIYAIFGLLVVVCFGIMFIAARGI